MLFTDKQARKIFNSIKCYECKESIESYPEDERDGMTDIDIIRQEVEYFIYLFEEVDGALSGDLEESREILLLALGLEEAFKEIGLLMPDICQSLANAITTFTEAIANIDWSKALDAYINSLEEVNEDEN